jgi:hypothetical protein
VGHDPHPLALVGRADRPSTNDKRRKVALLVFREEVVAESFQLSDNPLQAMAHDIAWVFKEQPSRSQGANSPNCCRPEPSFIFVS